MKRFLILLSCLYLVLAFVGSNAEIIEVPDVDAWNVIVVGGGAGNGEAACDTLEDTSGAVGSSSSSICTAGNQDFFATQFTVDTTYTPCSIKARLQRTATAPTYNIRAAIYSDSADDPSAIQGNWSDWVDADNVPTSHDWVEFANAGGSSISSGTYWIVLNCDGVDASNTVTWYRTDTAGDTDYDDDGSGSWSDWNAFIFGFETYK